MANTLSTEQGVKPDVHTVQQYLKFLTQAYLFSRAARYDVKGRRYMLYPSKWYAEDIGLRNARLNYRQTEKTHLMENIIYNELIARGYNVDVGVVDVKVAAAGGKREQETFSLRKTRDAFRKLVVVGGDQPFYTDENGISFVGVIPFLLDMSILSGLTSAMV